MHRAFVLCALAGLVLCGSTAGTPASPQQQSPRDVLEQFCELDAQGKQLTPGGWNKVARLFVAPRRTAPGEDHCHQGFRRKSPGPEQ